MKIIALVNCVCGKEHRVVFATAGEIPAIGGSQIRYRCPNALVPITYRKEVIAPVGPMIILEGEASGCPAIPDGVLEGRCLEPEESGWE